MATRAAVSPPEIVCRITSSTLAMGIQRSVGFVASEFESSRRKARPVMVAPTSAVRAWVRDNDVPLTPNANPRAANTNARASQHATRVPAAASPPAAP